MPSINFLARTIEAIKIHTRQFAKHQRTWFRRFRQTHWIDVAEDESADRLTERVLKALQ